jgi:hypothetical protein
MGMLSRAVISRNDGKSSSNLHPMGSINMAAQQSFARKDAEAGVAPATTAGMDHSMHGQPASSVVSFPYAFPQAGRRSYLGEGATQVQRRFVRRRT